jgi:hypothetical protein
MNAAAFAAALALAMTALPLAEATQAAEPGSAEFRGNVCYLSEMDMAVAERLLMADAGSVASALSSPATSGVRDQLASTFDLQAHNIDELMRAAQRAIDYKCGSADQIKWWRILLDGTKNWAAPLRNAAHRLAQHDDIN